MTSQGRRIAIAAICGGMALYGLMAVAGCGRSVSDQLVVSDQRCRGRGPIAFSPDGDTLYVVCDSLLAVDVNDGRVDDFNIGLSNYRVREICCSADESWIALSAYGGDDAHCVLLVSIPDRRIAARMPMQTLVESCDLEFSGDGRLLAVGEDVVHIYDLEAGFDGVSMEPTIELDATAGLVEFVSGDVLLVWEWEGGAVKLWNLNDMSSAQIVQCGDSLYREYSEESKRLFAATRKGLEVWDVENSRMIPNAFSGEEYAQQRGLRVTASGDQILTYSMHYASLRELSTAEVVWESEIHHHRVVCADVTSSGDRIALRLLDRILIEKVE